MRAATGRLLNRCGTPYVDQGDVEAQFRLANFYLFCGFDEGQQKRTQLEALARELSVRQIPSTEVSFPRYEGFFGKLVARFLNGEFISGINPMSDLYSD